MDNFFGDQRMRTHQILRSLECGFFMTHAEQEETAQLIRSLMDYAIENARLKGAIGEALAHLERGTALDVLTAIRLLK